MQIKWEISDFKQLSVEDLYAVCRLRQEVFVVEQNCPYLDADGKDLKAIHVLGFNSTRKLVAYARILNPGVSFKEISIGRVVTSPKARGKGAGKALMTKTLKYIEKYYGNKPIRIGAQCYLIRFYEEFGFEIDSEEYMEDGIPHIEMLKNPEE